MKNVVLAKFKLARKYLLSTNKSEEKTNKKKRKKRGTKETITTLPTATAFGGANNRQTITIKLKVETTSNVM